jgi:3-hydroxybutyryl-CoA dehydrogenase
MTGIIIADPAGQEVFRDIFIGTGIRVQWAVSPAESAGTSSDFVLDLAFQPDPARVKMLRAHKAPLVLVDAVTPALEELSAGPRLVRINGWNTFLQRSLAEVVAPPECAPLLEEFFKAWSKSFVLLPDAPGMPSARIVSMIINEAWFALGEGVSTRESIDTAMKLGTNYPFGPFEWCNLIGAGKILGLLERLGKNNLRYTIAPMLREEARSGSKPILY